MCGGSASFPRVGGEHDGEDGTAVVPLADARVQREPRAAPSSSTVVVPFWAEPARASGSAALFLCEPEPMARLPLSRAVAGSVPARRRCVNRVGPSPVCPFLGLGFG
jgi:hypothetical protein